MGDEAELIETERLSAPSVSKKLTLSPAQTAEVIVTFTRGLAVMERVHRDPKRLNEGAAALIKALIVPQ